MAILIFCYYQLMKLYIKLFYSISYASDGIQFSFLNHRCFPDLFEGKKKIKPYANNSIPEKVETFGEREKLH